MTDETYRLVKGDERADILARYPAPSDMPTYGVLVKDEKTGHVYLYYKNTVGYMYVIDVTANPPEHFFQYFPAPQTFWEEVWARISGQKPSVLDWVKPLLIVAVIFIGLILVIQLLHALPREVRVETVPRG